MIRYKVKTAPTTYPVSAADIKRNLRIPTTDTDSDRDALIQDLIYEAIEDSQNSTGRQYYPATLIAYIDAYPQDGILKIEKGPVSAINSIKYYKSGESEMTTVDAADYYLDNSEATARIVFKNSFAPDTERPGCIEIEYAAGWSSATFPKPLKQAIILRACNMYLNPENELLNFSTGRKIKAAEALERPYKVQRY